MAAPAVNVDDAKGLAFACLPSCGFCCTASPLVLPSESGPIARLVARTPEGELRIPVNGLACSALREDRTCGVYADRPNVCRVYPYSVHAGRRIQATVSLACPGTVDRSLPHAHHDRALHPAADTEDMTVGARDVVARVLAQPGAAEMAQRARQTFAEFDRRMKEWGVATPPDRLRAAFLPNLDGLARPGALPAVFAAIEDGDLALEGKGHLAVGAMFETESDADLGELLEHAAREAFEENADALWVEPDLRWTQPVWRGGAVELRRGGEPAKLRPSDIPLDWSEEGLAVVASYLARLCHRDHAEGAAAWTVDASGYQATPAAAFARVLAESALQVHLRAGLLAAERGVAELGPAEARAGIAAYETSFHSLPTLGSIL